MIEYVRYSIRCQSELLGNALKPDPMIFFFDNFKKTMRENGEGLRKSAPEIR